MNSVRHTGEDSYENSSKWVTLTFGSLLLPVLISSSSFKFLLMHIRSKHGTQPQEASRHLETDLPNTLHSLILNISKNQCGQALSRTLQKSSYLHILPFQLPLVLVFCSRPRVNLTSVSLVSVRNKARNVSHSK